MKDADSSRQVNRRWGEENLRNAAARPSEREIGVGNNRFAPGRLEERFPSLFRTYAET